MSSARLAWRPDVYLSFSAYRARPVDDLLPRIDLAGRGILYDLGCGPGNVTIKLKARWPDRAVVGIDSSAEMLDAARTKHASADVAWEYGDIPGWSPRGSAALIFANAALHWVPNHEELLPRLAGCLDPGGVLAVQMPEGQHSPYHTCIAEVAAEAQWSAKLVNVHRQTAPLSPATYYDLLSPLCEDIDIWETDYHHELEGENPVAAWAAGTALVPYVSVLSGAEAAEFIAAYSSKIKAAYRSQENGRTLFRMRRIFIVARKRA